MPKYYVTFEVSASASIEVEADNPDEAEQKAEEEIHVSLCHQCARNIHLGDYGDCLEVIEIDS